MGYHIVDPDALDSTPNHPSERRSISDAVDLSSLAATVYEIEPGERLSRTYHYHETREELFYVLAGTLTVRTPDERYEVPAGSVFVAEPGNPLLPHVPADARQSARVLGVGAPAYDPAKPYDPDGAESDPNRTAPDD